MADYPLLRRLRPQDARVAAARAQEGAIKAAEDKAISATLEALKGSLYAEKAMLPANSAQFMQGAQSRQPGTSWSNQGGTTNKLIARVAENLAANFNRAPAELEQALTQQGLTWGPPFPPGRPLDPFWGYRRPPKTWDYTVGINTQVTPRWGRISFNTIKALWENYDIAQIATMHLINDVRSLDYHYEAALGIRDDVSDDVRKAREFMDFPDKRQPFRAWLAEYMLDVIRYDAGALYIRRNNANEPYALEVVSGPTIIPNIDYFGRVATDEDPNSPHLSPEGLELGEVVPAYTQIIEGMPWDWLAQTDLIYQCWNPQPDSQYGRAPLESVLLTANTDVRFQWHFLNYFTQGNIPQGFMEAPPDLSDPVQIAEWQNKWDAWMAGDQEMLRRIRFIPAGAKYTPVGPASEKFDPEFPLYLMRRVCAAHGVTPNDLGFTDTVNKATSETQVDVQFRVGTLPLVRHVEDVVNMFLQQHLKLRVRLRFDTGREIEDRLATAQAEKLYIDAGVLSADEPRARLGYPVSLRRPTPRFVNNTRSGPIPLIALESLSGKIDVETFAPTKDAPLIDHPFVPVPGVIPPIGSQADQDANNTSAAIQANLVARGAGKSVPHPDNHTSSPPPHKPAVVKASRPKAAGIAVVAKDTGRVLMIQRSNADPTKKAAGRFEFPGGILETSESAWDAAQREWEEETGNRLPKGEECGTWENPKGPYCLFIYCIRAEEDVNLNPDRDAMEVVNPDHPNARQTEVMAWWDVDAAKHAGKAMRKELRDFDWDLVEKAVEDVRKDAAPMGNTGGPGVTGATGMQGVDLRDDDEDDVEAAKATLDITLRRWRENARNRLRKGLAPRRFVDPEIPPDLSDAIWADLGRATTRDQVDRAFLGKAEARTDEPGEYEQVVRDALAAIVSADTQRHAMRAAFTAVRETAQKATLTQRRRRKVARNAALSVLLNSSPSVAALKQALYQWWLWAAQQAATEAATQVTLKGPVAHHHLDKLLAASDPIAEGLAWGLWFELADLAATSAVGDLEEAEAAEEVATSLGTRASSIASFQGRKAAYAASMDVYHSAGVKRLNWVGGTCRRCQANAAASPIDIHGSWPYGPPPTHGSCHCSVVPA